MVQRKAFCYHFLGKTNEGKQNLVKCEQQSGKVQDSLVFQVFVLFLNKEACKRNITSFWINRRVVLTFLEKRWRKPTQINCEQNSVKV